MEIHHSEFLMESVNKPKMTRRAVIDQLEYALCKTRTFFTHGYVHCTHSFIYNAHIIC
jgi:hypothetical protein